MNFGIEGNITLTDSMSVLYMSINGEEDSFDKEKAIELIDNFVQFFQMDPKDIDFYEPIEG